MARTKAAPSQRTPGQASSVAGFSGVVSTGSTVSGRNFYGAGRANASKPRYRPKEIRKMQKTVRFCIAKAPFFRLVQEVAREVSCLRETSGLPALPRFQATALACLQEASEMFLVHLFEMSVIAANHAGRVTIQPRDLQLVRRIRGHAY